MENTQPRCGHSRCKPLQPTLPPQLGPIEYRAVAELKPYARNARRHPEKQLVKLAASITEFGFMVPALITSNGEVIAGEARLEAAKRAGLDTIPVICIDHLKPAQIKGYRLADNRLAELAEWDIDILASEIEELVAVDEMAIEVIGWEMGEIDILLDGSGSDAASDPADEEVEFPERPASRSGDLWLLGKHRLLCSSSLEKSSWERLMDGAVAAMAFTDPPYNVAVNGHICGLGKVKHSEFAMASGEMSEGEFTAFLTDFLAAAAEQVRDGAVLAVCMDWRHLFELQTAARAVGLTLLNMCVWNKSNGGMGSLYRSKHELVLILKKGKAPHTNNVELGKHGRYRTNVWDYAGVNSFGRTRMTDLADHPTVKPVALVADAIRDVTNAGDIVVDAFVGSGTTLLAAERTRRRAYGIELEPRYIDVAIRRWQAMTGLEAVLDATGETYDVTAEARFAQAATLAESDESLPEAA